jgi:hypothetical protein
MRDGSWIPTEEIRKDHRLPGLDEKICGSLGGIEISSHRSGGLEPAHIGHRTSAVVPSLLQLRIETDIHRALRLGHRDSAYSIPNAFNTSTIRSDPNSGVRS